jgi:ureidoglycolate hydrolase
MKNKSDLIEIKEYSGEGYKPIIDYDAWRVALLKYCDELLPNEIDKMQRHDETDEVFVLLQGKCILFLADGKDQVGEIIAENMEPLKIYNIKKSVWHTHTLSEDAVVLIVENVDTTIENSPEINLSKKEQNKLINFTELLWN